MKANKGFKQQKTHLFATRGFLTFLVWSSVTLNNILRLTHLTHGRSPASCKEISSSSLDLTCEWTCEFKVAHGYLYWILVKLQFTRNKRLSKRKCFVKLSKVTIIRAREHYYPRSCACVSRWWSWWRSPDWRMSRLDHSSSWRDASSLDTNWPHLITRLRRWYKEKFILLVIVCSYFQFLNLNKNLVN